MIRFFSNLPLFVSIIPLIVSILVSYYFYRNSVLTGFRKFMLITIKSLGIFLLLELFIEPSLFSELRSEKVGRNIVLVDDSRSNELSSANISRKEQIKRLLKERSNFRNNDWLYYFSSGNVKHFKTDEVDTASFSGCKTDLNEALFGIRTQFPESEFSSLTVVSDGCFNSGGNPLYKLKEFNCPVNTIAIGDSIQKKDLVIEKVLYNEKAFTNSRNVINVYFSAFGFGKQQVLLTLEREGQTIESKNIVLNGENSDYQSQFTVTESKRGFVKYRVKIDNKPGEVTYRNNTFDFLIRYIDDRVNVLYISSGPGYDNSFVLEILKRVGNYSITTRVQKNQSDFFEGPIDFNKFGDVSIVFLVGYPSDKINTSVYENLVTKIQQFKTPVLFIAQRNSDLGKLESLNDNIPFSASKSGSSEKLCGLRSTKSETTPENLPSVENLPQIFRNTGNITLKPGAVALIVDREKGEPILITQQNKNMNSAAFLAYGLWKWQLNDKTDNEKTAQDLIVHMVNQTVSRDKNVKIEIKPLKNVFDYTEPVEINSNIFDENHDAIGNAKVECDLIKNGTQVRSNIEFVKSNDYYSLKLPEMPVGDYIVNVRAYLDNNLYASGSSRFIVDTLNTEFLTSKSNFDNLRSLSLNTGGSFYKLLDMNDETKLNLNTKELNKEIRSTLIDNLWENKYYLIVIILIFSVEWFLRKRNNIA